MAVVNLPPALSLPHLCPVVGYHVPGQAGLVRADLAAVNTLQEGDISSQPGTSNSDLSPHHGRWRLDRSLYWG